MLIIIRRRCKCEWEKTSPTTTAEKDSHPGAASPHPPVLHSLWYVDDIFWKWSCLLFSFRDMRIREINDTQASGRYFILLLKWGSVFTKDPENGKKVSSSVGLDLSKMKRKGAWLFPPLYRMTPKEVKRWRQMRRSINEGDLDKFWVAHNEQYHFAARKQIVSTILNDFFYALGNFLTHQSSIFRIAFFTFFIICLIFFLFFWSGSSPDYSMEVCYQLPVLPLDRPVPKHVLSRRGAISFSSSSSLFGAPDPRQLSQVRNW